MSDQKTSAAKDVQYDSYAQNALDNYGELSGEFNNPGQERNASENQGAGVDERTTSAAKDVQLDTYAQSALDNYGELTNEFNGQDYDRGHDDGSQMVQQDAATNDNRPPPEMARDQDRETFNEKWAAEQERAEPQQLERDEYAEQALESYGDELSQDYSQGQDYGNDYSR